jgi:LPS O-antigen subunit length determinant protein (WzzB/FepE family)
MKEKDYADEYRTIFETAELNASSRIQQLNDAAEFAATAMVAKILRPQKEAQPVVLSAFQAITDRIWHRKKEITEEFQ